SAKYSYVSTGNSCLSSAERTRGRRTATRRPPSVSDPCSWPCRFADRSGSCLPFGPTTSSTSSSISSCTTPSPTPTLRASSPSLAAPTSSPSASWICAGNTRSAAAAAVTTVGPDTFLMAVPPVSNGLQRTRTLPTAADGAGGTAAQTSTRSRTTSEPRKGDAASLGQKAVTGNADGEPERAERQEQHRP